MNIDSNFLLSLIGLVVGGGITVPFTLKFAHRKASAEAFQAVQEVYQEAIADLREEKNLQKQELLALQQQVDVLRKEIYKLKEENVKLEKKIQMYERSNQ